MYTTLVSIQALMKEVAAGLDRNDHPTIEEYLQLEKVKHLTGMLDSMVDYLRETHAPRLKKAAGM